MSLRRLWDGLRPVRRSPGHVAAATSLSTGAAMPQSCAPAKACAAEEAPRTLFDAPSPRQLALMASIDQINARFGRGTVFPAAMGVERGWKLRAEHHSPCYTTRLTELPVVRA